MIRSILGCVLFVLLAFPGGAAAMTPEISGFWGWGWGGSADSRLGKFKLEPASSYSGVISVPAGHLNWGEFHYSYQGSETTLSRAGFHQPLTDLGIHSFQLVGLRALQPGKVQPFLLGGFGTTWFNPSASFFEIDGERYGLDSSWRLSFILGAGAKIWLGQEERVGLRLQIRTLPALYNTSGGIWVGSGGSSVTISGNALWRWDVSAGLTVKLGGR
jgi:opacity protein-like surface antigen